MVKEKRALLLVGSPRGTDSTSESLGSYLLSGIKGRGFETETLFLDTLTRTEKGTTEILEEVEVSDLIVLSYPLYIDTLPAPVIKTLELIEKNQSVLQGQSLIALANCGFPESDHISNSFSVCRQFASSTGMNWKGGLALGMGMAIGGDRIEESGFLGRNVRKALDTTIESVARGGDVPEKAKNHMEKPLMPKWLYLFIAGMRWRTQAWKNGSYFDLGDKPFQ